MAKKLLGHSPTYNFSYEEEVERIDYRELRWNGGDTKRATYKETLIRNNWQDVVVLQIVNANQGYVIAEIIKASDYEKENVN